MTAINPLAYASQQLDSFVAACVEFVDIPSISTLSEYRPAMREAAEWLYEYLDRAGLQNVQILPTGGQPIVFGERLDAPGAPTILVYGHYDVQPIDPLDEWLSPPFNAQVRGDYLYGRGVSDMKGQCLAVIEAIRAWLQTDGLPVNVKVLIEGEEEIESPNLAPFLEQHRDKLGCDLVLNCDSGILRSDLPSLVYGLRGMTYYELWVYGPKHDLHSGMFGGSIDNPAHVLCEWIAGMHDQDGRVTLAGFYDGVRVLSDAERRALSRLPTTDAEWLKITGSPRLFGEKGFTTVERIGARPTLEVDGIVSGFIGEGAKTVLPAKAMAKISMRLVPDQDDVRMEQLLRAYLKERAQDTIRWELVSLANSPAVLLNRDAPGMAAARSALQETFGVEPVFTLMGGSVPVVGMLKDLLGVDSVLMGFGLPDDNVHAPNERLHLPTIQRGIQAFIRFFEIVSRE
ncbi:MAG: dipeptidase [Anaerolineae bacterium]|nr:dipeptidase [Anaerolineae bacterium]